MNIIGPLLTFTELASRTALVCNGGTVLKPDESLHRTIYNSTSGYREVTAIALLLRWVGRWVRHREEEEGRGGGGGGGGGEGSEMSTEPPICVFRLRTILLCGQSAGEDEK